MEDFHNFSNFLVYYGSRRCSAYESMKRLTLHFSTWNFKFNCSMRYCIHSTEDIVSNLFPPSIAHPRIAYTLYAPIASPPIIFAQTTFPCVLVPQSSLFRVFFNQFVPNTFL